MQSSIEIWWHIICISLILLFTIFYCIFIIISPKISVVFKLASIIILVCAIYVSSNKNTYLPFLGYAAVPPNMFLAPFEPQQATEQLALNIDAPDGTKLIYWAANNSKNNDVIQLNPIIAYGDYTNSGISIVMDKKVIIRFRCPDKYKAGMKTINKHIHYRLVYPNSALMSPVYTRYVSCQ